ncbi:hypothetical protein BJY59DRAFT_13760 [Rhodotorula toruloides]
MLSSIGQGIQGAGAECRVGGLCEQSNECCGGGARVSVGWRRRFSLQIPAPTQSVSYLEPHHDIQVTSLRREVRLRLPGPLLTTTSLLPPLNFPSSSALVPSPGNAPFLSHLVILYQLASSQVTQRSSANRSPHTTSGSGKGRGRYVAATSNLRRFDGSTHCTSVFALSQRLH